jgi:transforming growth factor-beta-induced protein
MASLLKVCLTLLLSSVLSEKSIYETAVETKVHTILVAAIDTAGLKETLNTGEGTFTVFAPTDTAFEALMTMTKMTAAQLLAVPDLAKIVLYHAVPGKMLASEIPETPFASAQGTMLDPSKVGGAQKINTASVSQADVVCTNGVIHVISDVLMPPTIYDMATMLPEFSTLVSAIMEAGLVEKLSNPGDLTVFAPINDAFSKTGLSPEQLLALPNLAGLLVHHVVDEGVLMSSDLAARTAPLVAMSTEVLSINISPGQYAYVGGVQVINADIMTRNGVIHAVADVLAPDDNGPDEGHPDGMGVADGALRSSFNLAALLSLLLGAFHI